MRCLCLGLFLLAAGCGGAGDRSAGEGVEPAEVSGNAVSPVQIETLTGLYEGGAAPAASQLCILEGQGGQARFGLVARTARGSCSGAGDAVRGPGRLTLVMSGDSACRIEAGVDDLRVVFPPTVQAGCAYYCAPGATMAGAVLDKTGGTRDDAMRARDLVGDPLCAGLEPA
jgi:hypothetical protein